jgi:hypothetical protein
MSMFYWGLAALAVIVIFLVLWGRFMDRIGNPPSPVDPFTKKRPWRAISPSGQTPLGMVTYNEALALAAKMGKVSHVDTEYAFIFYDTHLGGPVSGGLQDSGPTP